MSKLEIINNDKNEPEKGYIRDAVLCYIKLQEGALKFNSKTEKEYVLDAVVDKATAKAWKKMFSKNTPKEIDTEDFEAKFKIPPPFPDQDEQFIIKVKSKAQLARDVDLGGDGVLAKGSLIPYEWNSRPKLFVKGETGVKDITMTTLAANGSKGDIGFKITSNDFGTFPQLNGVLVTDLIEYESQGGGSGSMFGEVEGGFNPGSGETMQKAEPSEPEEGDVPPAPEESEDDSNIPF